MILDEKKGQEHQKKHQADCIMERAPLYGTEREGYTVEDYYRLPDDQRYELIDGVLYDMAAPTLAHQICGADIWKSLKEYIQEKKGKCLALISPVDVQLDCDEHTMVQPDVLVVCDRSKVQNRCVYGAPDFVAEILSASTRWKDSVVKLQKYRNAGVQEYWLVDLVGKRVVVYEFQSNRKVNESSGEEVMIPVVYGIDQKIPVGIFGGDCRINMAEIYKEAAFLLEDEPEKRRKGTENDNG